MSFREVSGGSPRPIADHHVTGVGIVATTGSDVRARSASIRALVPGTSPSPSALDASRVRGLDLALTGATDAGHVAALDLRVPVDPSDRVDTARSRVLASKMTPPGFRVEARRVDPHAVLKLDKAGKEQISVWSSYRGTNRHASVSYEDSKTLRTLYGNVRDYFVAQGVFSDDVEGFRINLTRGTASYTETDPATGRKIRKEFDVFQYTEADPECDERIAELRALVDKIHPVDVGSRPELSSRSKGNVKGLPPARRTTEALQKLPFSVADSVTPVMDMVAKRTTNADQQKAALLRTTALEKYHGGFVKSIGDLITKKQKEVSDLEAKKDPADQPAIAKLKEDLRQLEKVRGRLTRMDGFAVATALSFFPTGSPTRGEIYQKAKEAQQAVQALQKEEFDKLDDRLKHPYKDRNVLVRAGHGFLRTFGFESSYYTPLGESKDFSHDVAGLMFSGSSHPRLDYYDFCAEHDVTMKAESLEDLFVKEVLASVSSPSTFDPKTAFASLLSDVDDPGLRGELETSLMGIKTECDAMVARAAAVTVDPSTATAAKVSTFKAAVSPPSPTPPTPTPPIVT
jgi:hypothetical protein